MKIYTKRGDDGTTGLFGGPRVSKSDLRVASYGDVDELNSLLGVVRAELGGLPSLDSVLERIQSELFTLGAELATPHSDSAPKSIPRLSQEDIERLEKEIDIFDAELPALRSFILPSGSRAASLLHLARTVCRRAERTTVLLQSQEPTPPLALRYLNRLSDHLFVLARTVNHRVGVEEAKWTPPPSEKK